MKTFVATLVLLAALAGIGYAWFWYNTGVSHRDIQTTVQSEGVITREAITNESHDIQSRVDNRYQKTMKKLEALEEKLGSVDAKLDKILEIANRPIVDNMEVQQ